MTQQPGDGERYEHAAALLPPELRRAAAGLPRAMAARAEELRLRSGWPMTVTGPFGEWSPPGGRAVEQRELEAVLEIATRASTHTVLEQLRNGFVTVSGGHRVGICGSVVIQNGQIVNLRAVSSLAIRVARQMVGIAVPLLCRLQEGGALCSTLIVSPPGGGKTTLLRDLIRAVSEGEGIAPLRVGVADERGELAAMYEGRPQLQLGRRTDVIEGCDKGRGLLMLLRAMNPQVLAADEITAPEDCAALEQAAGCGVKLLATAHGDGAEDLRRRGIYRRVLERGIFQKIVTIRVRDGRREFNTAQAGDGIC